MKAEGRRRQDVRRQALLAFAFGLLLCGAAGAQPAGWMAAPADGVEMHLAEEGGAVRVDFDFHGHGGYAIARRAVPMDLPENFEITFRLRGEAPRNTLEFKLLSGDNVWWTTRPDFAFPREWTRIAVKKRQLQFAWGPAGGGPVPAHVDGLEIVVTAGTGGRGTVWIDDLRLAPLAITSELPKRFGPRSGATIELDLGTRREFGGLIVDRSTPSPYRVALSQDGKSWETVRQVRSRRRGRDWLYLPDADARYVRLQFDDRARVSGVELLPVALSQSPNDFFAALAKDAPRGRWPRYLYGEQSYWTIVGADRSRVEALVSEDGAVEVGNARYSIEPFVWKDGRLISWSEVTPQQTLERGYLPIPTVTWPETLSVTAWVDPGANLFVRYRVPAGARLYLAIRPLQVNTPWQFLKHPGGAVKVTKIEKVPAGVEVTAEERSLIVPTPKPGAFGAARFDDGNVVDFLARGTLPRAEGVVDEFGYASAAMQFDTREVTIVVRQAEDQRPFMPLDAVARQWEKKLGVVTLDLPDARLADSIRSNLAYILINRDGAALQPGSRSYERSWIRDGSLESTALLRLGHAEEVRDFIDWYAGYQYADGKVPCCVGASGADPVPENDSQGEFIYLVAEYYRFTHDRALVERVWPNVEKAARYIDTQRHQRMTPEYEGTVFYGLVPESISHEGYSAKPMHSYWDDFFALRGLKDVAFLAETLGRNDEVARWAAVRDEFRRHLLASIALSMKQHHIDYIPGSAELGDFDATSTTIALEPVQELGNLPQAALRRTFDKYFQTALTPRTYTPYEWRTVGSMVRLGDRQRALELVHYFFRDQRPGGWNQWAEVVDVDPRHGRFIGDMPHTWVGSDFIRSALDLLAYESEGEEALVVAAGVPAAWMQQGIRVGGLRTRYGPLSYSMKAEGDAVRVAIEGGIAVPPGGIVVVSPLDGARSVVRALPAALTLRRSSQ